MEHRELADWLLECILNAISEKLSKRVRTYIRMMAYKHDGL